MAQHYRNNFSPEVVESRPCKFGCGKQLFFSKENRWYADDVEGKIRHKCPLDTTTTNAISLEEKIDTLNRNVLHLTSLFQEVRIRLDSVL